MGASQQVLNNTMGIDPKLLNIAEKLRGLSLLRRAKESVSKVIAPITSATRIEADQQAVERVEQLASLPLPEFTVPQESDFADCWQFLEQYVAAHYIDSTGHTIRLHAAAAVGNPYALGDAYHSATLVKAIREAMRCNPHLK